MPGVALDARRLVGAMLKTASIPDRAVPLAYATVALSDALEAEIRAVFARPKVAADLAPGRAERFLELRAPARCACHRASP